MRPRPCVSYSELLVYCDGRIYNTKTESDLHRVTGGSSGVNGPIVYHVNNLGKHRYLSVKLMVYECFVKKSKVKKGEIIEEIDGDPDNVHYTNLRKYIRPEEMPQEMRESRKVYGWNDDAEIYC